ncbi:MAG: DUF1203 domain-containing protein [Pseudomonadota bacterium]
MTLTVIPLDPDFVACVRAGGPDANGQPAEHEVSDGVGTPCRSCLRDVPAGEAMLVLAARPFPEPQPYAETGPIFLCETACTPWSGPGLPPILRTSPDYLLKGYSADHRIVYGTGKIIAKEEIADYAAALLSKQEIAFVDVRSARNNCFQARIVTKD